MEQFIKAVQDWGPVILIAWLYSILRYGKKNREKYKRWDKIRAKQRKAKWRRKQ